MGKRGGAAVKKGGGVRCGEVFLPDSPFPIARGRAVGGGGFPRAGWWGGGSSPIPKASQKPLWIGQKVPRERDVIEVGVGGFYWWHAVEAVDARAGERQQNR